MASTPYRQIRALYDTDTITVYQAYSPSIALPAVASQKLSASPDFKLTRMTWIKPSFCWMMYRSGYAFKDTNQSHILALRLKQSTFESLLSRASVAKGVKGVRGDVQVQWDPERNVVLGRLEYRSIQVGVGRAVVEEYVDGIVGIEDVTERVWRIKELVDEGRVEEAKELLPEEREYVVGEGLRGILEMD